MHAPRVASDPVLVARGLVHSPSHQRDLVIRRAGKGDLLVHPPAVLDKLVRGVHATGDGATLQDLSCNEGAKEMEWMSMLWMQDTLQRWTRRYEMKWNAGVESDLQVHAVTAHDQIASGVHLPGNGTAH